MKRRFITAIVVQIFLTVLSLLAAYNLDCLASGRSAASSWNPGVAFAALQSRKVVALFLLFTGLSILAVFCMAFGRSYINYKSGMRQITPEIATPMPAGQGQYGTARWLEQREFSKVFTVVKIDQGDPRIQELLERGYEDMEDLVAVAEGSTI